MGSAQNDPAAPANPIKFTGELADPTGLYYLRARQYAPDLGRFTGRDPVTPSPTEPYIGSFVYVADRPSVMTDPSGEMCQPSEGARRVVASVVSPEADLAGPPSGYVRCGGAVVDGVASALFGGWDTVKGKIFPPHGAYFLYWARLRSSGLSTWTGAFQVGLSPKNDLTISSRATWLRSPGMGGSRDRNIYPYRVKVLSGNPGQKGKVIVDVFSPYPCSRPDPVQ